MRGSAIYRIGYERWSRNIAVALGNAPPDPHLTAALWRRRAGASALLREHIDWALARQRRAQPN
ncbi:iron-sulfur cluster-binding protein [mine drainage metagenome]|uniref:Iron-sulfur cluster-binding protein n=1 Tax=mine drainage metagenome TaxID=410659 RepID=T1AL84_9ZZZZ